MDRYEISEVNFGKNEWICFELFKFDFQVFLKRGNHDENPWQKCVWINALHNILRKAGVSYLLWLYNNFSSAFMCSFKLGFTPCKAEQPLTGMVLKEKEVQKD